MKYDFTTLVNRTDSGSSKWDDMKHVNPDIHPSIVPLSQADMEFKNPPELIEGLRKYVDTAILGYTRATDRYYNSVCVWMERRHGYKLKKEWIIDFSGIMPAISVAIEALTQVGEGVIIMTPCFLPFREAVYTSQRTLVENRLLSDDDTYKIDFDDLEEKAKDLTTKLLILCSPHNPVGRVWTRKELEKVNQICVDHHVFVVSDEVHFDLIMPGYKHTVFATLSEDAANNCMVCTAPSKTFNLAGVAVANIIIQNEEVRKKVRDVKGIQFLNTLAYQACEIVYSQCELWLDELILILNQNRQLVEDFVKVNIPEVKVFRLEGTHLQWLDFNGLGLEYRELENFMQFECLLYLSEGYIFGDNGRGYERINIACPTQVLQDGLV